MNENIKKIHPSLKGENNPNYRNGNRMTGNYPCPSCGRPRICEKRHSKRICKQCYKDSRSKPKIFVKCKYCGKLTSNKKYCSSTCWHKSEEYKETCSQGGKIGGKITQIKYPYLSRESGLKASIINRKNGTGAFFDKNIQSRVGKIGGKKASEINRINGTSCFFDKKLQSRAGKIGGVIGGKNSAITNKRNGTGLWNKDKKIQIKGGKVGGKIRAIQMKENKTNFYDSKFQSKMSKRGLFSMKKNKLGFYDPKIQSMGGLACQHILRMNIRNLKFNNQYYDSKPEIEISLCLQKQFNYIPKEDKTLHIKIGECEYDYLLKNLKLFIEFHAFWKIGDNEKEYYQRRRENLDNNGHKDYSLIVIK